MPEAEQIKFYDHWLPAIAAGKYRVAVEAELKNAGDPEIAGAEVNEGFHVAGPRFSLTGTEAYSCYPAPGQIGQFDGTLPHIVFERPTLPWERAIGKEDVTKPHPPWLALILLSGSDFANDGMPTVRSRRLDKVFGEGASDSDDPPDLIKPAVKLAAYEKGEQLCQTIDLPADVFWKVMPRSDEAELLAHVREVDTARKETWALLKEGTFSVVVCNRFPETQAAQADGKDWGVVNFVYLVSLEGWSDFLPDKKNREEVKGKTFRLIVLASWRFICQGKNDFKSRAMGLNDDGPFGLLAKLDRETGVTDISIRTALRLGFVPLGYALRNGVRDIAWYRGPLVPLPYARKNVSDLISCGDAVLRYDGDTGTFDTQFASAWQLGRLLALQDQAFSEALCRFRIDFQRSIARLNAKALSKDDEAAAELAAMYASTTAKDMDVLTDAGFLKKRKRSAESDPKPEIPEIPDSVGNWLGQAMLLYGAPFQYLVPDMRLLEPETIRFFYLNPDWIDCLLQGACSIGRASEVDELADLALRSQFWTTSQQMAAKLRSEAKRAAQDARGEKSDLTVPISVELKWPITGYLLRSAAVEAWIGMEATASDAQEKHLQILRMDRLAPDVLLCLFNGEVTKLEVKQPPEALHFGAQRNGDAFEKTGLRDLATGEAATDNEKRPKSTPVPPRAGDARTRVVDINALAQGIAGVLNVKVITSAHFALEMIESAAKVIFEGA
jgi:hypothetical protein